MRSYLLPEVPQLDSSLANRVHQASGSQQVQQGQAHVHQRLTDRAAAGTATGALHHVHHHLQTPPQDSKHRALPGNTTVLQTAAVLVEMVAELEEQRFDGRAVLLPRPQQRRVVAGVRAGGGVGDVVDEAVEEGAPLLLLVDVHDVREGL